MTLAFWNKGSPRVVRAGSKVKLNNGDVSYIGARAEPSLDLYFYKTVGDRPGEHQTLGTASHELDGDTITTTYVNLDRDLTVVKDLVKLRVAGKRDEVIFNGTADGTKTDERSLILYKYLTGNAARTAKVNLHIREAQAAHDDHIEAIEALTTVADVVTYDINTNWPANPES